MDYYKKEYIITIKDRTALVPDLCNKTGTTFKSKASPAKSTTSKPNEKKVAGASDSQSYFLLSALRKKLCKSEAPAW